LRIEGLTYNEIGRRLTVTRERARQMVAKEIRQYHDLKEVIDLVVHIKRSTTKLS
jgi:DNA-directed RNA polymerase sigma subunit (sigma70/sigma32)